MTGQAKPTSGLVGIFMFILGIGLMIIADGIDLVFGIGFLFFFMSIVIALISITWGIAGTADKTLRQFTGDSD